MKSAKSIPYLFSLIFLASVPARAQIWQESHGPYGGQIHSLAQNPATGALFAAVYPSSIQRSTDNGASWETKLLASFHIFCQSTAVDDSQYLFAGTYYNGLYRSTNSGESWTLTDLKNKRVGAIRPIPGGIVFAGAADGIYRSTNGGLNFTLVGLGGQDVHCVTFKPGGLIFAGTAQGFHVSSDGGSTWNTSNAGLTGLNVWGIIVHPSTGDLLLGSNGIYRSTDDGANWVFLGGGSIVYAIAVDSSGVILAGTVGGILRSTDNGSSWAPSNTGFKTQRINDLLVTTTGDIYAATGAGMYRSTDHGVTWSERHQGMLNTIPVTLVTAPNGDVYAGIYSAGLFRTRDGGFTWVPVGYPTFQDGMQALGAAPNGTIFAGTNMAIHRSTDNGDSWTTVKSISGVSDLIGTPNGTVFFSTYSYGLYRSVDGGNTWIRQLNGLADSSFAGAAVHAASGTIYLGSKKKGIYRSTDNGDSWAQTGTSFPDTVVISIAVDQQNGDVYAGFQNIGGLHRSTDQGATWQNISGPIGTKTVQGLIIQDSGYVYAGLGYTPPMYRSTDRGASWSAFWSGLAYSSIWDMTVDSSGFLYTGSTGYGVQRTTFVVPVELRMFTATWDEGAVRLAWETMTESNNAGFAVERRIDRTDAEWREVGFVKGRGTSETPGKYNFTDAELPPEPVILQYRLRQIDLDGSAQYSPVREVSSNPLPGPPQLFCFPNPLPTGAGGLREMVIRYRIASPSHARIDILNIHGATVATLADEQTSAGTHDRRWFPGNLPGGVYFCRLSSGGTMVLDKILLME